MAHDLRTAFPHMKGFSPRNLKSMRAFADAWPDAEFVQQAAARWPWSHLCTPIDKPEALELRDWYLAQAMAHNGSRNVVEMQIKTRLHARSGQAVTHFAERLPAPLFEFSKPARLRLWVLPSCLRTRRPKRPMKPRLPTSSTPRAP